MSIPIEPGLGKLADTYEEKFKKIVESKTKPEDEVFRGTLAPKTIKEMGMKELYSEVMKWGEQSILGHVCGIYGCNSDPDVNCKYCKCTYCHEHIKMHMHAVKNDGIFLEDL